MFLFYCAMLTTFNDKETNAHIFCVEIAVFVIALAVSHLNYKYEGEHWIGKFLFMGWNCGKCCGMKINKYIYVY
jgi:hypothetical protein